jgi:ribulose kinase
MQIHSDVSGVPIQVPEVQDAPLLGSAILAAVASESYPSIDDAADKMVRIKDRIEPIAENHKAYKFFVDQYIETYARFSDLMHKMTNKIAAADKS